ncbi:hypothetical protein AB0M72_11650 [Nocardiopsis dassonvillei]
MPVAPQHLAGGAVQGDDTVLKLQERAERSELHAPHGHALR